MSRIRYGSTSGGYRVHNTIMRDPILGLPLEDLSVLMAQSGSDLYLDARKADGFTKGINSPLVNPWVDLTKNGNNATFQNLAGTTSDGWVNVLLPNGKTMPFLKLDGVDTVGIIPNNPSVDIVGLDEFEIDMVILTPSVLQTGFIVNKNTDLTSNTQYGILINSTGAVELYLNGGFIGLASAGSVLPNSIYNLKVYRANGVLNSELNGVIKYNQPNTTSLISRPNIRIGARSNNVSGTTHAAFSNTYIGALSIAKNPDFTKLSSAWAKVVKDYI